MLGGAQPVQLDEAGMAVVEAVVFEYNRREDDQEFHKLVKVHEATSQVGCAIPTSLYCNLQNAFE